VLSTPFEAQIQNTAQAAMKKINSIPGRPSTLGFIRKNNTAVLLRIFSAGFEILHFVVVHYF